MEDLKKATSYPNPGKTKFKPGPIVQATNLSLQTTPEKRQSSGTRFSKGTMQYNYCQTEGATYSDNKESMKKVLDSSDVFNMRNSKIMDQSNEHKKCSNRPSSLQKKRQQRKTWQRKSRS